MKSTSRVSYFVCPNWQCQQPIPLEETVKFCPHCRTQLEILQKRYCLLQKIDKGQHDTSVHLAVDLLDKKYLAIKRIEISREDTKRQKTIDHEVDLLEKYAARFPFMPNLATYWYDEPGGKYYIVMEYIEGTNLLKRVEREGPWSADQVNRFLAVMLLQLGQLHAHGIIHRDIKPNNIIQTPADTFVILDFGITKVGAVTVVKGYTRPYSAPEQLRGKTTDARSDLYSLGATAYYLLTSRNPSIDTSDAKGGKLQPPGEIVVGVPAILEKTIMWMLEDDPERRPRDADQALAHLNDTNPMRVVIDETTISELKEVTCLGSPQVRQVAFAPNGQTLALATACGVELWQIMPQEVAHPQPTISAATQVLAWHPNGQLLASASEDGQIRLWYPDGKGDYPITGWMGRVLALAWRPDGAILASIAEDGIIRLWDISRRPVQTWQMPAPPLTASLDWSRNGHLLLCAVGHELRLIAVGSNTVQTIPDLPQCNINATCWNPDDDRFAVALDDGTIRVYAGDGTQQQRLDGHAASVTAIAWMNVGGHQLVSASADGNVCLWHVLQGNKMQIREPSADTIHSITWNQQMQYLATAFESGVVTLWHSDGKPIRSLQREVNYTDLHIWSADEQMLACAARNRTILILNAAGEPRDMLRNHTGAITDLAWNAESSLIASASSDESVRIWKRAGTAHGKGVLRGHAHTVQLVRWSADGCYLLSLSVDGQVCIWNSDGDLHRTIPTTATQVHWHPGRNVFVLCNGTAELHDLDGLLQHLDGSVHVAAWSPDGQTLATAGYSELCLRNDSGEQRAPRTGLAGWVTMLAWGPAQRKEPMLASASDDGSIRLWRADGVLYHTLTEHTDWINALAWGKLLASASHDGTVRIWHDDGTLLRTLHQYAQHLSWSPDGSTLTISPGDGTLRLWRISDDRTQTLTNS